MPAQPSKHQQALLVPTARLCESVGVVLVIGARAKELDF